MSRIKPILRASRQHGTDAAGGEALDAIGEFVVDVAGGHHRLFAFWSGAIRDAVEDSAVDVHGVVCGCVPGHSCGCVFADFLGIVAVTRKPPQVGIVRMCCYLHYSKSPGVFESFFGFLLDLFLLRLVED